MAKYSVVGGNPFRHSYTGLRVVGVCDTPEEVKALVDKHYEGYGGLMLVIDLETGQPAKGVPFGAIECNQPE